MINNDRPIVMVISGSSGAGKDTVLEALKAKHPELVHITTATTRSPRVGEIDKVHYYFYDEDTFKGMIEDEELLEFAHVYDKWYGVPKQPVRDALKEKKDTIIKVDVQGAMTIKKKLPDAILLFVMPPDIETIEKRLRSRNTDSEEAIQIRLATIKQEMEMLPEFNHAIINADGKIDEAVAQIEAIINAEKERETPRVYDLSSKRES